ncbi:MAG: GTP pyrophosphokinase family protein [Lachnospiraceae bacterium]
MLTEDFLGPEAAEIQKSMERVLLHIEELRSSRKTLLHRDPVEYCKHRLKSYESIHDKLLKNGLPVTKEEALANLHDIAGIRIVCTFVDDVYSIVKELESWDACSIDKKKDYISKPKPNGYRSCHIVLSFASENQLPIYVEIQIRTIAMDCWASLEHQLKYKKEIQNSKIIVQELKRCADELASADLTLETLRELIADGIQE